MELSPFLLVDKVYYLVTMGVFRVIELELEPPKNFKLASEVIRIVNFSLVLAFLGKYLKEK